MTKIVENIKHELIKFWHATSMKGISRAVRYKKEILFRILGIVSTIILVSISTWNVCNLINQFYEYQTTICLDEHWVTDIDNQLVLSKHSDIPDVTICTTNPLPANYHGNVALYCIYLFSYSSLYAYYKLITL